jgi:cephalosporin-C deacetylase-like acetyl esterase
VRTRVAWVAAALVSCIPGALEADPVGRPASGVGAEGGGDLMDFDPDEFWREQSDVPFDEVVLEDSAEGDVTWQAFVYTSERREGAPMRIFAYYARPRARGPHPAVVSIHGGGGGANLERAVAFAKAGYACVSYDWHVYGEPPAPPWSPGQPLPSERRTVYCNLRYDDWARHFVEKGADWKLPVLYRAAMAARRALTWLERRDEVDATRLAVEGHSWGGYLTQLVSGIDGRVRASVSSAAAGAWLGRYDTGLEDHTKSLTPTEMREWSRRYDPASYAARVSGPILIRLSTGDFFGSIDTLAEYWSEVPEPKALELQPSTNHGFSDVPARVAWFDRWLAGGREFPRVESLDVEERPDGTIAVRVRASGPDPIAGCAVSYTTSPGPWNRRFWTQRLLERSGGEWAGSFAPNLAGGSLRVFASVTDGRGLCASCMPVVRDAPSRGRDVRGEQPAAEAEIAVARARGDAAVDWRTVPMTRTCAPTPEAAGQQSLRLGAAWDDAALWLRADVDDATPWSARPAGRSQFWDGDSIQIRLRTDARCLEPGGPDAAERVIHLGLYPDERSGAVRVHATRGRDFSVEVADISAVSASVDVHECGGYALVVRLPWLFLDDTFTAVPGRRLRMGAMVNFGDALRPERIGIAECNRGGQYGDPDAWGTARLAGE